MVRTVAFSGEGVGLLLLIAACELASSSSAFADCVLWEPRIQITHTEASGDSIETQVRGFDFQRDASPGLYALIAINNLSGFGILTPRKSSHGYVLAAASDSPDSADWASAWDGRTRFTHEVEGHSGSVSTDHSMAVDDANGIHVVYEDWARLYAGLDLLGLAGYKGSEFARWSEDSVSLAIGFSEDSTCSGNGPTMFLWEGSAPGTAGDTLHAMTGRVDPTCTDHSGWRVHTKRALSSGEESWSDEGFIAHGAGTASPFGAGAPFVVDENLIVHLFGARNVVVDATHTARVVEHIWGEEPAPGDTMVTHVDVLDSTRYVTSSPSEDMAWAEITSSEVRGATSL